MKAKQRAYVNPINVAEAIIDPLWDPARSGFSAWKVQAGAKHGLRVEQSWCYVAFEWARPPKSGPALSMRRVFDLELDDYVTLLACIMAPEGSMVELLAETDRGVCRIRHEARTYKGEYALDLKQAARLRSLTISILSDAGENQMGWLYWIGLQKEPSLLDRHLAQWQQHDPTWPEHLQPADAPVSFQPKVGLLANHAEWQHLARCYQKFVKRHDSSSFQEEARQASTLVPEKCIGENIKCMAERWFCRERENDQNILGSQFMYAETLAVTAMLERNPELLRLAARHALSIASCEHWDDFCCYAPGGSWDQRCFTASICAYTCAFVLDVAWDMFTPLGRDFLMERIAKLGVGDIRFNIWKYDYIFDCNQLAFFIWGGMPATLLLESVWPRIRSETELAYTELLESLNKIILPDGGYVEGPTYFRMVGKHAGAALFMYARQRRKPLKKVVPPVLRLTADFASVIASTDDSKDVIPFCDARDMLDHDTLAFMAACLPKSQWTAMYRKSVNRNNGLPGTLMALQLDAEIPESVKPCKPFIFLPVMGVMASTRTLGAEVVKLFLMGNMAGAGHTHEDKGSFVLEFAGDTFASDPGTADYSLPNAARQKYCQFHNMLLPTGISDRPHPASPLPVDVKPEGTGDRKRFHARMDLSPGWEPYYKHWRRTWESSSPEALVITDEYELAQGTGVDFLWQTRLPVEVKGHEIWITGKRATAIITTPEDTTVAVQKLLLGAGGPLNGRGEDVTHFRISVGKKGRFGVLKMAVRLKLK